MGGGGRTNKLEQTTFRRVTCSFTSLKALIGAGGTVTIRVGHGVQLVEGRPSSTPTAVSSFDPISSEYSFLVQAPVFELPGGGSSILSVGGARLTAKLGGQRLLADSIRLSGPAVLDAGTFFFFFFCFFPTSVGRGANGRAVLFCRSTRAATNWGWVIFAEWKLPGREVSGNHHNSGRYDSITTRFTSGFSSSESIRHGSPGIIDQLPDADYRPNRNNSEATGKGDSCAFQGRSRQVLLRWLGWLVRMGGRGLQGGPRVL